MIRGGEKRTNGRHGCILGASKHMCGVGLYRNRQCQNGRETLRGKKGGKRLAGNDWRETLGGKKGGKRLAGKKGGKKGREKRMGKKGAKKWRDKKGAKK